MIKDETIVREEQLVNLKTLKKLDEICKKYDIRYWVAYGTLIGTIRHKGFVPWDDDLDVGMLREDYVKLCNVPDYEWGDECAFMSAESDDPRHDKIFGRVYMKNTRIQSRVDVEHWKTWEDEKPWYTALMCDIFVYDHVPDSDEEYRNLYAKIHDDLRNKYKICKLKYYAAPNASLASKGKAALKRMYGAKMRRKYQKPWVEISRQIDQLIEKSNKGKRIGEYLTNDTFLYDYDEVFPLETATFEDMEVPIPKNWHQMLSDFYGDYMKFPPENERYHLDFIFLDLGDDKKYILDPIPGSLGAMEKEGC